MAPPRLCLDAGAVLCGGRSLRMGRDKAGLRLGGETLLERAAGLLDGVAPRVFLACGESERYRELGRELVLDNHPEGGPLAGLEAALTRLAAAGGGWLGVVAVDMPRASAEVLARCAAAGRAGELDVVLFADGERLEPLLGVYHTRALPAIRRALAAGERRVISFHADVRVGRVDASELTPEARASAPARNLNTPADFERERGGVA
ncbi:MAG: molybdenum cofactor guanylyltransferase [Planctomycetota bacterium]